MKKWLVILLLLPVGVYSQEDSPASVELSADSIQIGEQVELKLSLVYRIGADSLNIGWPEFKDTVITELEILEAGARDTSLADPENDDRLFRQSQILKITCFEEGFFAIPPINFSVNGEEIASNPTLLSVYAPVIAEQEEFRDIKDIKDIDYSIWDFIVEKWMWFVGGLLVIIASVVLFIILKKQKPQVAEESVTAPPKPEIPAHEEALQRLRQLKEDQLWQKGLVKEYYVQLTDIVRTYIERRYSILALEETSSQIIRDLNSRRVDQSLVANLQQLLELSDLVKFAKSKPGPQDHETSMARSEEFIIRTKELEMEAAG